MKSLINKLSNVYVLVAVNLVIILSAEFVGGGLYFAQSGLIHLMTILLALFAFAKIISHYSFSDKILKGFLNIQSISLVFLGLVHVFEYLAHWVAGINMEMADLLVIASYLVWFLTNILGYVYLSKSSYHGGEKLFKFLAVVISVIVAAVLLVVVFGGNLSEPKAWIVETAFSLAILVGFVSIFTINKTGVVMPVFRDFVSYHVIAGALVLFAALFEFLEIFSVNVHMMTNIARVQFEYFTHFAIYIALSVLIVGFEKLFHLPGVYEELKEMAPEKK